MRIIGNAAAGLEKTASNKNHSGAIGEKALAKKIEKWAETKGNILCAYSFSTDGAGDIDCLLAGDGIAVMIDAKKWGNGYYGLTKDFKIRRSKNNPKPKGRGLRHVNSVSQAERLQKLFNATNINYRIAKPIVCLIGTVSDSVKVWYNDDWKQAPFTLTTASDIEIVLNHIYPNKIENDPELDKLEKVLNARLIER